MSTETGEAQGAAYVFERVGTTWNFRAKLVASDGLSSHNFGWSVWLDGTSALVGSVTSGIGAAYVYSEIGGTWIEQARLSGATSFAGDTFGAAVALGGSTALVGATHDNVQGSASGSVYVFERAGTTWTETAKLLPSDGEPQANFGRSIALQGDTVVVGAYTKPDPEQAAGAAYVFVKSGPQWSEVEKLVPLDHAKQDQFGSSVAYDGRKLLVGATGKSLGQGAAYVFLPGGMGEVYCTAKQSSCGTFPAIDWTGTPSASASSGFVVRAENTKGLKAGLLLYGDTGRASAPFEGGILCLATPVKRTIAVLDTTGTPGQCNGVLALDMNAFAAGALGGNPLASLSVPGTQVDCQFWGRDTPGNALLSDAFEYFVCE